MSYTPPDPFQHNHNRQTSLATVYEENDPYRIIKKSPRIGKELKKKKKKKVAYYPHSSFFFLFFSH